ncbi:proto-oncogene tyrosine-protein kinase ROS isoform X2 [Photinus pyralis]|uniref:proto-oncogene tyrosine-protein kinase ROS isoform X2 n=1 Tax=Photinus pyralis TaxID=7054 RepID=UPI001267827D|nr:proto-oncogene tyrosine-protein kinase ROS isoform X2 [Photinus pyralis]
MHTLYLQVLIVLYSVQNFVSFASELLDVEVEQYCIRRCSLQNRTDEGHYELDCGYECSTNKCVEGCKVWKQALDSSCQTVCNGTLEPLSSKELYCVMSCNDALTRYCNQLRAKLGTPIAPALVADSLTSTSLRLEWKFPEAIHAGLKYFVQWRYEELAASWQYCRNHSWGPNDTVMVDNLQPYTKYRFRVALLLSPQTEPIVSAPSVVISTLPAGVPTSPPIIVRAVPIDSTHISISWEPGPFPHGPLLSYVLRINDSDGYSALKDIPAENTFYTYRDLMPARNYTVAISMTNGVGTGPAAEILVSTPQESLVKELQQPVLILNSHHLVIEQGTDMLAVPVVLYSTQELIKGIAIHISKKLLFVSDSSAKVYKISFANTTISSTPSSILSHPHIDFLPQELSVDWLNNQLYILGEVTHQRQVWQITRCNLDGHGHQVALAGLRVKPHHIEVDPYNGFLFWVIQGSTGGGLFRLDLADISNGIKHNVHPEQILSEPNLGAFTVDHTNFRLLCSNQNQNTINSVSLDGKEIINVRPKIITRKLQKVLSLATANKTFYWTDGNDVFYEEFHSSRESYYHNTYPDLADRPYLKVIVNLESSQPTPIPINPPTLLQAIFGPKLVKISWKAPHLLGDQGKGAWQNWSYEISIKAVNNNNTRIHKNINVTSCTISNLEEGEEYVIKAAAYTNLGKGPWSSEFRGRTLKVSKNGKYPTILWSAASGLLRSDATGENVQTLVQKNVMNDYHIIDIAWHNDCIYVVTNNSQIFWHNLKTHKGGQLVDIESVSSIAVDWIGKKLYWSNPKQQLILRGNLNGTQQEPLPILTLAKELNIDAVQAYLYWSTGHAVECSRLNGADRIVYHPAQHFSGKQVMGLTLDMHRNMVYWIIRGSEGSNLFRAPMAGAFLPGTKPVPESVSGLQKPDMQGPLCYFNDRLLWLKDDKNAVISDLMGKNVANIQGKDLSGLTMIFVMDSNVHTWPNISSKIGDDVSVIPEPINRNSIKVVGFWDSFNITWEPSQKVNFGTVFYEIKVDNFLKNSSTKVTTFPSIQYWQSLEPYTKLQITIKAYTYWGSSAIVRAKIYSPPSTPSAPENLRTYLSHQYHHNDTKTVDITIRWDAPLLSNGVIQGYKVKCWYTENLTNINLCEYIEKKFNEKEHILKNLQMDKIYYVQVQAYTEIGDGSPSKVVQVNTTEGLPLPKLLVATSDSIFIHDMDKNKNDQLLHGISTPLELAYIIKENKVFWINDMHELLVFSLTNLNRTKICDLNGEVYGLTIDWVERSLYYIQILSLETYSVNKLDLNYIDKGSAVKINEVFRRPYAISKVEVSPFSKKIYWVEVDDDQSHLMQCNTNGTEIKPFLSPHGYIKRDVEVDYPLCNCPLNPVVEKTFAIDHSNLKINPQVVFADSDTYDIISADKYGCNCQVIAHKSLLKDSFPLNTLRSDFGTLYWTNSTQGLVYSLRKNDTAITNREHMNVQNILIFGTHMQPYPPRKCLTIQPGNNVSVQLLKKTSTSLTLALPEIKLDPDCQTVSIPTIEYKIFYKPYNEGTSESCDNSERCNQITTFTKAITISNLKSFTKYVFIVRVGNYFTHSANVYMGPPVILQTSVGAPSKPENVTATILNPTLIEVSWAPPREMNSESVSYEIHWQTAGDINGIRQKGEQIVSNPTRKNISNFSAQLYKLSPNETYLVWIRAYSQSEDKITHQSNIELVSSDSESIKITTYAEPENITLMNSTADELSIQMKIYSYAKHYVLQYAYYMSSDWINIENDTTCIVNDTITMRITNLHPKTQYKFRMVIRYPNYSQPYIWPTDSRFTFETLGDRPSPPGVPIIQHIKADVYQVWWEPSKENGAAIEMYLLEGLRIPNYRNKRSANRPAWFHNAPSVDEHEDNWIPLYNGTDTFWIITGLKDDYRYAFRASALNTYGWSNTSEESSEFDLNVAAQLAEKQDPVSLFIIAGIPVAICVVLVICVFCCCRLCCSKSKEKQMIAIPRGPDAELATLRELPRRWVHNTNILYTANQLNPDEITMLPHIRRDQIKLMKFLGSGAFGEVFEGKARNVNSDESEVNVAIKTLRKGASDTEKCEFLQEAQLMSHFKHEHILQLLGVCLDNDPQFIIMELMQGGDLLTYLRSSRNPLTNTPSLTLKELLKMCVDVAKGCRYLEEMHFVHRDLACRNCLVSSTDPSQRIVKIGDFGLTRDIYKNDYYRKEGEGLLPVRWMAPESLVDGVFTCQSDVWAFGVLLWEIMTLGQQPYPARTNLEVLHYVKGGGRLGKPVDCPDKLHELMLKCWSYEPERRPTFKYCLSMLDDLHVKMANDTTSAHDGQYISTVLQSPWKGVSDDDADKEKTPFLKENDGKIPVYLELIYDGNCPDDNDGYEIPRSSMRSSKSEVSKKDQQCDLNKNEDEYKNNIADSNGTERKVNDKVNSNDNKTHYINPENETEMK